MIYRLAVLGDPVAHSRSPMMHTAGLRAAGLDGSYVAIRSSADEMTAHADRVRSRELTGANITMPHKRVAASLADELTDRAGRARSVNTWFLRGHRLVGDTTDVPGIIEAMHRRGVPRERVLILGTGGAAAAALVALDDSEVFVSGRSAERTEALIRSVDVDATVVGWGVPVEAATVVNATPIGMRGEELPETGCRVSDRHVRHGVRRRRIPGHGSCPLDAGDTCRRWDRSARRPGRAQFRAVDRQETSARSVRGCREKHLKPVRSTPDSVTVRGTGVGPCP